MLESTLIFANARVYTWCRDDATQRFAECIIVSEGNTQHVGSDTDHGVAAAKAAGTRVRDMQGQTMLPAMIDGRLHLVLVGQALTKGQFGGVYQPRRNLGRGGSLCYGAFRADSHRLSRLDALNGTRPPTYHRPGRAVLEGHKAPSLDLVQLGRLLSQVCDTMGLGNETSHHSRGTMQRGQDGRANGILNERAVLSFMRPFVVRVARLKSQDRGQSPRPPKSPRLHPAPPGIQA
ncbi:hypothetical protein CDD82_7065 [Ophiocordyceps australis]|uniref:Uncharacterized protein n=1 Tax=Ophiocordyceps australis TaxID=1399860 RepID=A0A2C5YT49_9HYPO|nr:hypothetical protein CDD82_7065 [Ophiocordyceps australis]